MPTSKKLTKRQIRRKKIIIRRIFLSTVFLVCSLIIYLIFSFLNGNIWQLNLFKTGVKEIDRVAIAKEIEMPSYVDCQFIHKHNTARSGTELSDIKNIVIHYVGNPGTTAQNNRDYFDKEDTSVSSHFIVGLEGEIIQCLPLYERSAATNHRNKDTISIEVCHPDESGKYSIETYQSLIKLTAFLCNQLSLDENDIIRHYDVTGKNCPKYYVENENEWKILIKDVGKKLEEYEK